MKKGLNVLVLSSGRRVELIDCFKIAAKKLSINSKIIAADSSCLSPSLYIADSYYITPPVTSEDYIQKIIAICNLESISLIVPTIDTDLLLLAHNKETIESNTKAKVLISNYQTIHICRDKTLTAEFLEKLGFLVPKHYDMCELTTNILPFPLFIKPKSGSSSKLAFKVENADQLDHFLRNIEDPLIQDFIQGDEYSVDVFLDFQGKIISVVPRLRIATRDGEISKGKIVKDREIIDIIKKLMMNLAAIGHITIQLMKTKKGIEFIEINPRFGGGAPMSIMSGADSCEYLYRLLSGEKLEYNENYIDNLTYLRFDRSICINDKNEVV